MNNNFDFEFEKALEFIRAQEQEDGPRDWVIDHGKIAVEFSSFDEDFGYQSSFALMPSDPARWEAWWDMMIEAERDGCYAPEPW